jgi:hypothetical protein
MRLLSDAYLYRMGILAVLLIYVGLSFDVSWHRVHGIRDFYFIGPHIVIYIGIILLLASSLALKAKGYGISLWAFVLFPLLSVFDEVWHRVFGLELETSPLLYWSPAHWSFGLALWYVLFQIVKLPIEQNQYIAAVGNALIWYVIPVRFIAYILVPLSPFSSYVSLRGMWSITIPITIVLIIYTIHKYLQNALVVSYGVLFLASTELIARHFGFFDRIYHPQYIMLFLFSAILFVALTSTLSRYVYMGSAVVAVCIIHGLFFLTGGEARVSTFAAHIAIAGLFAFFYYDIERYTLSIAAKYFPFTMS